MEPIGPIGINSLGYIAPIGPVEPIGPIGINSTYRANWAGGNNWPKWHHFIRTYPANWADGTNWPNWHLFIGTYRTNWACGTNLPNLRKLFISRQLGRCNQLAQLASIHWDISHQLGPWNQLAQLA